ncbi:helix-turn-helix domain-containing protein [Alistipes sp. Marseille-P5061]|uniref:helix-turn-helix domain-containing protein n=1 Tax=Alistipes sp. Marseille-P5061 TaxID=2048242 RepID=UPI0026217E70|nr:helix-turn-helix domain-containing protein [uncultured Alistipes sp.]
MDSEEVCRALNISKRTLQSYRDRGAIPCSRLGGKFYYRRRDLAAWLSRKTIQTR